MAKKSENEEGKKGAGVPWSVGTAGRAATGTFSQASQITIRGAARHGLAAAAAHFFSTGPGMLALTAMVAGTSFFSMWDLNRQKEAAIAQRHAAAVFNQATSQSRAGAVRGDAPASGDSLSYLMSANQGAVPDASGSAPAQSGADASAQAALQPQVTAQPVDANASGQNKSADAPGQAQAAAQAAFGSRYGQMSASVGGGNSLAGGGGMAGGIGRHFDSKSMAAKLSGAGASSGAQPGPAATAAVGKRAAIQSGAKGARGQLNMAAALSQGAKVAPSGESSSYQAAQAFEGNHGISGDAGNQTGGAGAGQGASAQQTGGAGLDNGGPIQHPDSGSSASTPSVPSAGPGRDVTPWGGLAEIATILSIIATVLLVLASNIIPLGFSHIIKAILATAAAACAAAVTAIGIILMVQYGQMIQGMIFTAVGAILTLISTIVAVGQYQAASTAATTTAGQTGAPASTELSDSGSLAARVPPGYSYNATTGQLFDSTGTQVADPSSVMGTDMPAPPPDPPH